MIDNPSDCMQPFVHWHNSPPVEMKPRIVRLANRGVFFLEKRPSVGTNRYGEGPTAFGWYENSMGEGGA